MHRNKMNDSAAFIAFYLQYNTKFVKRHVAVASEAFFVAFSALTLSVERQEEHPACKK